MIGRKQATILILIAVAACSRGGTLGDPAADDPSRAPDLEELTRITYAGILDQPITLVDGRWEGKPFVESGSSRPSVGLIDHFLLTGDLDEDGLDDAAALLWESSGGSGTRLYLAAVGRDDREIKNLGPTLVGDRVQIRSGAINDGKITLEIVRAGPDDAAYCPTEKALVTWVLNADGLSQIADETTGTLSLADLAGHEWILIELGRDQPLPQDVEISLLFQDDKVSGNSGCNNYFAGIAASRPGEFSFNGMGATRMACPETMMDVERRYLQALAGASGYRFLAGQLVLTCNTDEGPQALVFTARENPAGIPVETGE